MHETIAASTYLALPPLTLEELARFILPSRSSHGEVYREFFSMSHIFEGAVRALEKTGRLPRRHDGSYRTWDPYYILRALNTVASINLPEAGFSAPPSGVPSLYELGDLDEAWWTAAEATRTATAVLARARSVTEYGESDADRTIRLADLGASVKGEIRSLASHLPPEECFWQKALRAHASTVLQLRDAGYRNLAKFCARQFGAAVELATQRLGQDRRGVRAVVGIVPEDHRIPAVTAASFSRGMRAFDLALDSLEAELAAYNGAMSAQLQLAPGEAEALLVFLRNAGLEVWYTELAAATWDAELLEEMTYDQRVAASYGRIRALAALQEESIFSFAEATCDGAFTTAVTDANTLQPRLREYLKAPPGKTALVTFAPAITTLAAANAIKPPISAKEMGAKFAALGVLPGPAPVMSVEQVLASLLVLRNMTSHRFPVITEADGRPAWLPVWEERLPAINRALVWSAFVLWALKQKYS